MRSTSLLAIAALTFASAAAALAQTQSQVDTQTQVQPPATTAPAMGTATGTTAGTTTGTATSATAAPPSTTETPAPIVVETTVDLTTEPGPPADLHAAREEAVNALHWAKTEGCRNDASPRQCVQRAQDEYQSAMARLRGASGMGRN